MESQTSQTIFSCSTCSKKYTSKVRLDTHQLNCESKLSEMKMKEQLREEKRLRKQQEEEQKQKLREEKRLRKQQEELEKKKQQEERNNRLKLEREQKELEKKKHEEEKLRRRKLEKEQEEEEMREKHKLITCEYCNIQFPAYNFPPHVSKCKATHEEEKNKARKILEDSYFRKGLCLHPDGSVSLDVYEDYGVKLVRNRKWILDGNKVVGKKETGIPDFCELNDAHIRILEKDGIPYEKYSMEKLNELIMKAKKEYEKTHKPERILEINKCEMEKIIQLAEPNYSYECIIPTYEDYLRERYNRIVRTRNPLPLDTEQIKNIYGAEIYSRYLHKVDESAQKQYARKPQLQFID